MTTDTSFKNFDIEANEMNEKVTLAMQIGQNALPVETIHYPMQYEGSAERNIYNVPLGNNVTSRLKGIDKRTKKNCSNAMYNACGSLIKIAGLLTIIYLMMLIFIDHSAIKDIRDTEMILSDMVSYQNHNSIIPLRQELRIIIDNLDQIDKALGIELVSTQLGISKETSSDALLVTQEDFGLEVSESDVVSEE